jgi:hypothetical protein
MMAQTASIAAQKVAGLLADSQAGLGAVASNLATQAGIDVAAIKPENIVQQNVPAAVMERSQVAQYPSVHVYVDRVQNVLAEKFRTFSGTLRTVAEVRVSQDRIEGIEDQTRLYVDAVTQILDANRGSWGQGMFFAGGYEVKFEPVGQGGRNFLQTAKVVFEVNLSA